MIAKRKKTAKKVKKVNNEENVNREEEEEEKDEEEEEVVNKQKKIKKSNKKRKGKSAEQEEEKDNEGVENEEDDEQEYERRKKKVSKKRKSRETNAPDKKKKKKKNEEEEEQEVTVSADGYYDKLQTRVSVNSLYEATKQMCPEQMDVVRSIGFGKILEMEFNKIPLGIAYFCVENFNSQTGCIELPCGNIDITRESIHIMFGLPMEGGKIEANLRPKKTETNSQLWRKQYDERVVTPPLIKKKIVESKNTDWLFILDFLVLCASTIIEGNQMGSANFKFLQCITNEEEIKKLDWCGYMLRCLKKSVRSWKNQNTGDNFVGSTACLVMHYVHSTRCGTVYVPRNRPAIAEWTTIKLIERENAELALKGFGYVELIDEEDLQQKEAQEDELYENAYTEEELEHNLRIRYKHIVAYKEEIDAALSMYPQSKVFKRISDEVSKLFEKENNSSQTTPFFNTNEDFRDVTSDLNTGQGRREFDKKDTVPFSMNDEIDPNEKINSVLNELSSHPTPDNNNEDDQSNSPERTVCDEISKGNGDLNEDDDAQKNQPEQRERREHKVALVYMSPFRQRQVEVDERVQMLEHKISRFLSCFVLHPG